MRLFDAILIVPLYETFIIFNMIILDAVYFGSQEPNKQNTSSTLWFWFGILLCITGMFTLTIAQKNGGEINGNNNNDNAGDQDDGKLLFEDDMKNEEIPLITTQKQQQNKINNYQNNYYQYDSAGNTVSRTQFDMV